MRQKKNQIDESQYTMSEVIFPDGGKAQVFSPIFATQEEKEREFEKLKQATAWFLCEAYKQMREKKEVEAK